MSSRLKLTYLNKLSILRLCGDSSADKRMSEELLAMTFLRILRVANSAGGTCLNKLSISWCHENDLAGGAGVIEHY